MDPVFQALSALPTPMPQFHVVVDNVAAAAEGTPYSDALMALASVAAVLWTGGLIVRQLFPSYVTMIVQNGMFFTMFATFASIGALVAHGEVLRIMVGLFFLRYVWIALVGFRRYRRQLSEKDSVPAGVTDKPQYFRSIVIGKRLEVALLVFYVPIIVCPTNECVAWTAFFAAFVGYQLILSHLEQAREDGTRTTIMSALLRVLQYMDRWNGLIPAPAQPGPPVQTPPNPPPNVPPHN
jgi:hypothetical protein